MSEDRDFDWVRGKVPRYNQDGDDISDDELGAGGRRREDGKLAGLAYDLEYYNPEENDDGEESTSEDEHSSDSSDRYAEGIIEGVIIAGAIYAGAKVIKWAAPKVIRGGKKAVSFIKGKLHPENEDNKEATTCEISEKAANHVESAAIANMPDLTELDNAYQEYHRDMSNEEVQRHLLTIAIHYMAIMNELKQLYGVRVSRDDWNAAIEKLTATETVAAINQIIGNNPTLLEDNNRKVLSALLQRDVIVEGEYVPIEKNDLRNAFNVA